MNNTSFYKILSFATGAFISFFCFFLVRRLFGDDESTLYVFLLSIVILYIASYLNMIFKVAGHLVCGLLTGYSFLSFRIGNMMWIKQGGVICFRRTSLGGTVGIDCQFFLGPPEMKDGRMPYLLYILGGVLANLIASAFAVIVVICFGENPWVVLIFTIFAVVGVLTALKSGLPIKNGGVYNNAARAIAIGKSAEALRAFWTQMKIAEMAVSGVRLKDIPAELFELDENADLKNVMVATIAVFRAIRLVDNLEFKEAKNYIDFLLDGDVAVAGIHRYTLSCDRIYLELLWGRDTELINRLLNKNLMKYMRNSLSILRTQYAYALFVENDKAKADDIQKKFDKMTLTYPYASDIESERELMRIAYNTAKSLAE